MARATRITFPDPFLGWGRLAWKSAEMLAACAVVIPHRTSRANAPLDLYEMGAEKGAAAFEAWNAMGRHWVRMQSASRPPSLQQWAAFWSSGLTPFHRRAVANSRKVRRRR